MQYTAKIVAAERVTKLIRDIAIGDYFEHCGHKYIRTDLGGWRAIRLTGEHAPGGTCFALETRVCPTPPPTWATEPKFVRFETLGPRALFEFIGEFEPAGIWMRSSSGSACRMDGSGEQVTEVNCAVLVKPLNGKLEVTRGE